MYATGFARFKSALQRHGISGVGSVEFVLGTDGPYELRYIPFEYVNQSARLVIVGITPGPNQLELAYTAAQKMMLAGVDDNSVLAEIKRIGGFGGPAMRPNLVRMLRHFGFERLLGIDDVESLWGTNAHLLHSTSVVAHAAFRNGMPFNGSFDAVLKSPLLKQCFLDGFVSSLSNLRTDALFVALGDCPKAALAWCVDNGYLGETQVLGAFCHPSRNGGSAVDYYLRERVLDDLAPNDPVRHRASSLDANYRQMAASTGTPLGTTVSSSITPEVEARIRKQRATPASKVRSSEPESRDEHRDAELAAIIAGVAHTGITLLRQNAKIAELLLPSGQSAYIVKGQSRLNNIVLGVHPNLDPDDLARRHGVQTCSNEHRFHSNMGRFPKRRHKGEKENHYCWHIVIDSTDNCQSILSTL